MLSLSMYRIEKSFKYNQLICVFMLVFIVSFTLPVSVPAQKAEPADQVKRKKTTRIFYGQASFYANKFNGRRTASGEIFDQKKLTCACNALPLGTWVKVTNLKNKRTVIVKVNDRIHPKMRRVVDLSVAAAKKLGFIASGLTRVKVEVMDKKDVSR
jgi:rare lipoprotein A